MCNARCFVEPLGAAHDRERARSHAEPQGEEHPLQLVRARTLQRLPWRSGTERPRKKHRVLVDDDHTLMRAKRGPPITTGSRAVEPHVANRHRNCARPSPSKRRAGVASRQGGRTAVTGRGCMREAEFNERGRAWRRSTHCPAVDRPDHSDERSDERLRSPSRARSRRRRTSAWLASVCLPRCRTIFLRAFMHFPLLGASAGFDSLGR
mmetsp:Transcript_139973/g.446654  ORF Transcript_139973/g.446654 Transcript_139973/m.446654 type:complete len:208 (-) Transcript_139973:1441-2064(-)